MTDSTTREKSLIMTVLTSPDMVNFSGKVHGGAMLKILDQVAYACAARYAGQYVVTLSADQVSFRQPIHLGELVTLLSNVNYTGRSSMEIGIKVVTENPLTGVSRHVMSCYFTMVAVDADGKPVAVPKLVPKTDPEKRLFANAEKRRELRAAYDKAHAETLRKSKVKSAA